MAGGTLAIAGGNSTFNGDGTGSFLNDGTVHIHRQILPVFPGFFHQHGSIAVPLGIVAPVVTTNMGTVTVTTGGLISTPVYTQSSGSTILSGGEIDASTFTINGGTLSGSGTIEGPLSNAGAIIPGGVGTAASSR